MLEHVLQNVCDADRLELVASYGEQLASVALACLNGPAWCVIENRNEPVCAFGWVLVTPTVAWGWSFGTDRAKRAMPELTDFIAGDLTETWRKLGVRLVEVRSLASNKPAHSWLRGGAGFELVGRLRGMGMKGEEFLLFALGVDHGDN